MHTLEFSLSNESVARVYDAVLCLAKFGELVSLEARIDRLTLTALNSSKSAYASFQFDKSLFFEKYVYSGSRAQELQGRKDSKARFTCQLYNKALLSVFRGRLQDKRDGDTAIERCEVFVQDEADKTECRLVVKMICRHGVIKTYKLTYESVEVMQALFDKGAAKNRWRIGADVLRTFTEYFGAGTEQLDICSESGRVAFTSYTEKIATDREILKHPLHTSIAIDELDFEEFAVEEKLRVGISVKDFKAIVTHAETLTTSVQALYSFPTRPLQLNYQGYGMQCDFTLMTIGEYRGQSATPAPANLRTASIAASERSASRQASRPPSRSLSQELSEQVEPKKQETLAGMPPPSEPASRSFGRDVTSQRLQKPSPPPPRASVDTNSLFIAEVDEEQKWEEPNYEEEDSTLGWNPHPDPDHFSQSFHSLRQDGNTSLEPGLFPAGQDAMEQRIPPTQRIKDIHSVFGFD